MTQTKPHHHGDLRSALIEAGIEILETEGLSALSLRKCAARAGVSHAAPAHHFQGASGLRQAIAQEGFRRFAAEMTSETDAARHNGPLAPRDQLKSICRGYVTFARRHPALYALIFSSDILQGFHRGDLVSRDSAYQILARACAPFVRPGQDPATVESQVWSLIHGYTQLYLGGRFGPPQDGLGPIDAVLGLLDTLPDA